jgi:gliding motility-associated-like protein
MTGTTSDLSSSYIEEVNIGNPMLSCFYMDLGNLMPFGAFSINSGGSSQAYIISTVFVSNNIYSSTLMEVNMSARTIGPVLCTYPFSITGAASVYTYTPLPVTPPSVSISLAQGDTCNSKYLTFTSSVLQGGPSPNYQWTRNGVNVGANSANYTDSVVYNGDSIQCTVTSGDDCSIAAVGASNIIIVNLNSLLVPAVTIRASADSICQADSIVFTASAINGGLQPGFQWRKNGVPVGSDTSSYTDYKLLNGDLISCTMTSNAGKCLAFSSASSAPLAITVFADPVVPLSHAIALCKGEVRQLDAGDFSSFLWSDGSTGRTLVVADTGTYYVTVTDKNGCKGSDTIAIVISTNGCLAGFFIPSGFTPNNDGKNDIFKPTILGRMTKYQFTIYDRWGMMVFQTADINQGWDGTVSGKPQSANTFAWSCSYQIEGEPARVQRGTVLLIR